MVWWQKRPQQPTPTPEENERELAKAFHIADFGGRSRTVDVYYEKHGVAVARTVEIAAENDYEFVQFKHDRMGRNVRFKLRGGAR